MRDILRRLLADAAEHLPGVSCRSMFGGTAWFVAGEMFAVTFADQVALKLSPEDRDRALSLEGARLFDPLGGRPMRRLVSMPPSVFEHHGTLAAWVNKSHAFAVVASAAGETARPARRARLGPRPRNRSR